MSILLHNCIIHEHIARMLRYIFLLALVGVLYSKPTPDFILEYATGLFPQQTHFIDLLFLLIFFHPQNGLVFTEYTLNQTIIQKHFCQLFLRP